MTLKALLAPLALLTLVACGGVSDAVLITDLTTDDITSLCEEFNGSIPATTCTTDFGDVSIGGLSPTECATDFGTFGAQCTASVQDMRACNDIMMADPCVFLTAMPTECEWMSNCAPETPATPAP